MNITAFFDDSWSKDRTVFTLAGYIASDQVWETFSGSWRSMLRDAPARITEFETCACRHSSGQFAGWTKIQKDALATRAVDIIVGTQKEWILGFSTSVSVMPGHTVPKSRSRLWEEMAFDYCVLSVLWNMIQDIRVVVQEGESFAIVFDKKSKFAHLRDKWWAVVKEKMQDKFVGANVADPRWGESDEEMPLQAADLLAYETSHEAGLRLQALSSSISGVAEAVVRPVSTALRRLVESEVHHVGHCVFYDKLIEHAAEARATGKVTASMALYKTGTPFRTASQWPNSPLKT